MSAEELHQAVGAARENFQITRWILKGIPPVYDIEAWLDVGQKEKVGEVVQSLVRLQTATRQIGVKLFPYGIPVVDGALISLEINTSTGA